VTLAFRLPILAANVNRAAQSDYFSGLALTRRDSTIDQALPLLERAVTADPDSPLTYAALAEAESFKYFATKDPIWRDRFTESVRQAEMRNPDLAEVHLVSGILKSDLGLYEPAATEYLRAIDLRPQNGAAHMRLGQVYERNNLGDRALDEYRKAVEVDPSQYRNQQALASFFYKQANYIETVKYLRKMVELAPDEFNSHFALGTVYMDLGRFPEAEQELHQALALRETWGALLNLGDVLMYEKRDAEAIPNLLRASRQWPNLSLIWMALGNAYRRTRQSADSEWANKRGLEAAERELKANPRNGKTRAQLAYLCARLNDRARADLEVSQALLFSPNDADTRFIAAETYEVLGHREDALTVLSNSPDGVISDMSRWPDLEGLRQDPGFLQLLVSRGIH